MFLNFILPNDAPVAKPEAEKEQAKDFGDEEGFVDDSA